MSGRGRRGASPSGLPVDPQPQPRRLREWPFLLVLLGVVVGLTVVAADRFRVGSAVLTGSVVVAAILRAGLPERDAGLLVVRSRAVDVLVLGVLGTGLAVLTVAVPPPT